MGRPPPEGARVAYALAQFIFIVRDPIDTLSSCIIALANGGALWKATWQRENNLNLIKEQIQTETGRILSIARGIANCISRNEGTLVRYEDLKANPLER